MDDSRIKEHSEHLIMISNLVFTLGNATAGSESDSHKQITYYNGLCIVDKSACKQFDNN